MIRILLALALMSFAPASMATAPTVVSVQKVVVISSSSIANSGSTSTAVYTGGLSLVGIQLPAAFTGTALTFTVSVDGVTYQPLYTTTSGTALSYTVAQGHYVAINPQDFYGANYIKIISGSSEAAARTLSVILKGL